MISLTSGNMDLALMVAHSFKNKKGHFTMYSAKEKFFSPTECILNLPLCYLLVKPLDIVS